MRILVVEDERKVAGALKEGLEKSNIMLSWRSTAKTDFLN